MQPLRICRQFLIFVALAQPYTAVATPAPVISVYTTAAYPVTASHLATHIYHIDRVEQFENSLSRGFSNNPQVARNQAQALFDSPAWKAQEATLKEAYAGVISGWQNGIKKVPAVLFEHPDTPATVVYGETDIAKATRQWQQWSTQREVR